VNPSSRSENISIETVDSPKGACVMRINGPLTLKTLFDFQEASRKDAGKSIIVDLNGVPYMDSAGLGSVISLYASCERNNRGFAVIGVSERIRTLFEVTHVDGLLPCFDSLGAADAAISK
jgi:anti-anti-sigma factor